MGVFNFVIRDGLHDDIERCLNLDHTYTTDHVWQMNFQPMNSGWQATFRAERLPREIDVIYPASQARLTASLEQQGFLIAIGKDEPTLLGYLNIRHDSINRVVIIHDLVVASAFRRAGVGSRLMAVAKRWAHEQQAHFLIAETQTKNYPAIQFCHHHGLAFCGFNDKYFLNHEIALFFGQDL